MQHVNHVQWFISCDTGSAQAVHSATMTCWQFDKEVRTWLHTLIKPLPRKLTEIAQNKGTPEQVWIGELQIAQNSQVTVMSRQHLVPHLFFYYSREWITHLTNIWLKKPPCHVFSKCQCRRMLIQSRTGVAVKIHLFALCKICFKLYSWIAQKHWLPYCEPVQGATTARLLVFTQIPSDADCIFHKCLFKQSKVWENTQASVVLHLNNNILPHQVLQFS